MRKYKIKEVRFDDEFSDFYPMYKDLNCAGYFNETDGKIYEYSYFTKWVDTLLAGPILDRIKFKTIEEAQEFINDDFNELYNKPEELEELEYFYTPQLRTRIHG